jgi:predicted metal-dependent enzyme (double-stranded beta helix superfamily)
MSGQAIQDLVTKLRSVAAEPGTPDETARRVAALARPLAEDTSWIEPRLFEANEAQGFGVTILHEEAEHGLLVETVCWLPGRGVAPHDHRTWGVVIGLKGSERNINWRRLDDGSRAGYADLAQDENIIVERGDTVLLMPDDIHSVRNEGEEPSLSLHIYGRSLAHVNRSEFDPITKVQRPCPQRVRAR